MNDPACIFCKIALGQIPALRVTEDEVMLAFLDIGPLAEGHVLLIPKAHYVDLNDVDAEVLAAMVRRLPDLSAAVLEATGAAGCNVLLNSGRAAGQEVMHMHWHIIPRRPGDGLGYRWNAGKYPPGRGEEVARRIVSCLVSRGGPRS